jgi:2-C-methyl-D-erythritol 2,4-cyclodiphosphate synthase
MKPTDLTSLRIGHGYDIHRITAGGPLVLGGVEFPVEYKLEGHSDADCLTHAICDALLGAAGLPDIGHHFPNTDSRYENINSQKLLQEVTRIVKEKGYAIINIDASLIAEKPKIGQHLQSMKQTLANSTGLPIDNIGLKATTNEGVDDIGLGLAIAAHAVCLLTAS